MHTKAFFSKTILEYLLVLLFFSFAVFFFYGGTLDNFFLNGDDFGLLKIGQNFSWNNSLEMVSGYFRPLLKLVLSFIYTFYGLEVLPYRLLTIFLHLANVFLVFLFVSMLLKDKKLAFFSAFLFAVFFLHAETVFWFAAIGDLMMTFFSLTSAIFFVKFLETDKKRFFIGCALFFAFAIFTKEPALLLPLNLFAIEFFFYPEHFGKPRFGAIIKYLAILPIIAVYFLLKPSGGLLQSISTPQQLVLSGIITALFLFGFSKIKNQKIIAFSFIWFFSFIAPAIILSGLCARYFYLPMAGISILAAYYAPIAFKKFFNIVKIKNKVFTNACILLFIFSFLALSVSYVWDYEKRVESSGNANKAYLETALKYYKRYPDYNFFFIQDNILVNYIIELFDPRLKISSLRSDDLLNPALLKKGKNIVLFFDREKMALKRIKSIKLSENLVKNENMSLFSDQNQEKINSTETGLIPQDEQNWHLFYFSYNLTYEDCNGQVSLSLCEKGNWGDCKRNDEHFYNAKYAGSTANNLESASVIETQKARYFVLRLNINGKGKAQFKNFNLQKITLDFE